MKHPRIAHVVLTLAFACAPIAGAAEPAPTAVTPIQRRSLMQAELPSPQAVTRVEATEITLAEGVSAPRHRHPCPVVGRILDGTIRYQIDGSPERLLHAGDAFLEPANAAILHFDNAGRGDARFVAFYLVDGANDNALVEILR